MPSAEDILVDNLREALKDAHRQIVFGTGAALFFLLLVIQDVWGGGQGGAIVLPLVGVQADRSFAEIIAAVAYFIAGYLAYLAVSRVLRIKARLQSAPQLREAVLMYPSIPTLILTGARIGALLLPVVIFVGGFVPILVRMGWTDETYGLAWVAVMLSAPYILLVRELRYPLSEVKYKLTTESLERMRSSVTPELIAKLAAIEDREYKNRDLFVKALKGAVGREPAPDVSRIVLRNACEEEGIEN
jgi:hypothetical protein